MAEEGVALSTHCRVSFLAGFVTFWLSCYWVTGAWLIFGQTEYQSVCKLRVRQGLQGWTG